MALTRIINRIIPAGRWLPKAVATIPPAGPGLQQSDGGHGIFYRQFSFVSLGFPARNRVLGGDARRTMVVVASDGFTTIRVYTKDGVNSLDCIGGATAPEIVKLTVAEYGAAITGEIWVSTAGAVLDISVAEFYRT